MDKSRFIFGNEISSKAYRKALRTKERFVRKYGDDTGKTFHLSTASIPSVGDMLGIKNIVAGKKSGCEFGEKSVLIGNIRMGYGHYRISMALASAARSMGYEPYWFDLHSFQDAACGKIIGEQNKLYSLGSRISQRIPPFNKYVWEPLNSEVFRRLDYNAGDQKTAELMTSVFQELPKNIPFIAAHAWPSQAAVHAGMKRVVNVIPDNWPMALHLSEGAIHTVQTPSSYIGYRTLRGMDGKKQLKPMPKDSIYYTGHYIDHELVANTEIDCAKRTIRAQSGKPRRWLMSVGGAGAQRKIFVAVIKKLLPEIRRKKAVLFLNAGDHKDMIESLLKEIPQMKPMIHMHSDDFGETSRFCDKIYDGDVSGIHLFCYSDIFAAVYSTNLLMRVSDILITKPSELAFYPIPKLMIKRVGGHEAWGAIHSAEIGDGTYECTTIDEISGMIDIFQNDSDLVSEMCRHILMAKRAGVYDGAYEAVKLAVRSNTERTN
ncbi:MAG: hypothetical protein IJ779_04650 [Ruminococcus sp.]|nr:hypothetical protein [Ruminococcus sp.]